MPVTNATASTKMGPKTRSMSAHTSKAAASKVAGSRVSRTSSSKTARSRTNGSKVSRSSKPVTHSLSQADAAGAFPFLSLPDELRNQIYEHFMASVSITAKKHTLSPSQLGMVQTPDSFWPLAEPKTVNSDIWLIRKSLPLALLSTCRIIYTEVAPLFAPLLTELAAEPLRFVMGSYAAALALTRAPGPLIACLGAQAQDTDPSCPIQNKAVENCVALCRRPPTAYNTGDADIQISIIPKEPPRPSDVLERVFESLQARVDETPLRFRVLISRFVWWAYVRPMQMASLNTGDGADVVELDFISWLSSCAGINTICGHEHRGVNGPVSRKPR